MFDYIFGEISLLMKIYLVLSVVLVVLCLIVIFKSIDNKDDVNNIIYRFSVMGSLFVINILRIIFKDLRY